MTSYCVERNFFKLPSIEASILNDAKLRTSGVSLWLMGLVFLIQCVFYKTTQKPHTNKVFK
jgi:hypothetical protein